MPYHRAQEIESRLANVLQLIRHGRHSSVTLAGQLNISQPTVYRCLSALRERGHEIRAVKDAKGWSFEILERNQDGGR